MLTLQQQTLSKLIDKHPEGYVKITIFPPHYIPISLDLYNFEYIRTVLKINGMRVEKHNNVPVIFSCDPEEWSAFETLNNQLITGRSPNFSQTVLDIQLAYILVITRISNSTESRELIKNVVFGGEDIWLQLLSLDIDLASIFSDDQKISMCKTIHKLYYKKLLPASPARFQDGEQCRYGLRCRSLQNKNFVCKYDHVVHSFPVLKPIIKSGGKTLIRNDENIKFIRDSLYKYGLIYICTQEEFVEHGMLPLHCSNNDRFFYRVSTGMKYEVVSSLYDGRPIYENAYGDEKCVILNNPTKYDLELNCVTIHPMAAKHKYDYKMCKTIKTFDLILNNKPEKFHYIGLWKPYICGYGCDKLEPHPHGN